MASPETLFALPNESTFDPARWAEAAFNVWQGSHLTATALEHAAEHRTRALIVYAREASPFYSRLYRRMPWHGLQLRDLPPVTKRQLMDHFDDAVTHPGVTRQAVEAFIADPARIGHSFLGRFGVFSSSGTTGTPGYFVHDPDALAVYDALEGQRFRGLRSPTDLLRQVLEGDRYAMVAATEGHFAGVATVERMRRWAPWMSGAVRAFALLQPCARTRAGAQSLSADDPGHLSDRCRNAGGGTGVGTPSNSLARDLDRRRGAVGAQAPARRAGLRLSRAQRVRRVGVPADRVGVPAPQPARELRLGRARAGGSAWQGRRAGYAFAHGVADQSGQPGPAADPLRPR